jgi:hypothetical protein
MPVRGFDYMQKHMANNWNMKWNAIHYTSGELERQGLFRK